METFSALLDICAGNSPVPGEIPTKGQWRGNLMFSLICVWINGWVNNGEAGDLRRYRAHYYVTVMQYSFRIMPTFHPKAMQFLQKISSRNTTIILELQNSILFCMCIYTYIWFLQKLNNKNMWTIFRKSNSRPRIIHKNHLSWVMLVPLSLGQSSDWPRAR